jgi:hypothetical protein
MSVHLSLHLLRPLPSQVYFHIIPSSGLTILVVTTYVTIQWGVPAPPASPQYQQQKDGTQVRIDIDMTLVGMEEGRQREVAAKKVGEAKCVDSLPDPNILGWHTKEDRT